MDSLQHSLSNFELTTLDDGFQLTYQQRTILRHTEQAPCLWIGGGEADIDMFRGNFSIKDRLNEKIALTDTSIIAQPDGWTVYFSRGNTLGSTLVITTDQQGRLKITLKNDDRTHNRIWLRLAAQPDDHIYGW